MTSMHGVNVSLLFWMFFVLTVEPQLFRLTSGPCHFSSLHFHSADCLVPQLPLSINLYHSPAYLCRFSPKSFPDVFLAPPFVPLTKRRHVSSVSVIQTFSASLFLSTRAHPVILSYPRLRKI